jgi:hypothetical protein
LPLIAATEHWARTHKLTINMNKTVYAVFNQPSPYPIRIAGKALLPACQATYLGFVRAISSSEPHLPQRVAKAKKASFAILALLRRVPHLRPKV